MRIGDGMWGMRSVLLAIFVGLMTGAAFFPTGSEVWLEQSAHAALLSGTSVPGREELGDGAALARLPMAPLLNGKVSNSSGLTGKGIAPSRVVSSEIGRQGDRPIIEFSPALWEATNLPSDGVIVSLFDLLAVSAIVVTFGVLIGSWTRRGH